MAALPLPFVPEKPALPAINSNIEADNQDENQHRYVGLVNQAMTCYLNSLIQTLYMTPEFRNAIYEWKFSGKLQNEANNIPYQLQKLFLLLQTSDRSSLETKDLTASFGWDSNEAYDQHDVQELCRIMFDALEHRWRNSKNSSLIQDLYKGTMEDYVKCHGCGQERSRKDVFLDLPLPIKPFGPRNSYKSIEEALSAFIKPEELNGNNQYQCEQCGSNQDAEKGLRITSFPKLLTIQLKRFDFDSQTLHRMKLNSQVTFPDYLDVNSCVYKPPPPPGPKLSYAAAAKKSKPELSKTSCSKEPDESPPEDPFIISPTTSATNIAVADENVAGTSHQDNKSDNADTEKNGWLNVTPSSEIIQELLRRGPYVYELFSIMVHQGSASAGHYFAYIKNMDQSRWFCFNDSSVQSATLGDIYRTFGGWSYGYPNNMNAYMLMYRRIDSAHSAHFIRTIDLPQHLKELQRKLKLEEEERERKQRFEQELVKIHFICNEPGCLNRWLAKDPEQKNPYVQLIHKDVSLDSVFDTLVSKVEEELRADSGGLLDAQHNHCPRLLICDGNWVIKGVAVEYSDPPIDTVVVVDDGAIDVAGVGEGADAGGVAFVVGGDEEYKKPLETLLPNSNFSQFYRHDLYLMIDTKPKENVAFYQLAFPFDTTKRSANRYEMRTYEVWIVDLSVSEVRIGKRVCLSLEHTVGDLKRLLADLLPEVYDAECHCIDWIQQNRNQLVAKRELRRLAQQQKEEEEEEEKAVNELMRETAQDGHSMAARREEAEGGGHLETGKNGSSEPPQKSPRKEEPEHIEQRGDVTAECIDQLGPNDVPTVPPLPEEMTETREKLPLKEVPQEQAIEADSTDAVVPDDSGASSPTSAASSPKSMEEAMKKMEDSIEDQNSSSEMTEAEKQRREEDHQIGVFDHILATKEPICPIFFDSFDRCNDDCASQQPLFMSNFEHNGHKLGELHTVGYINTLPCYIAVGPNVIDKLDEPSELLRLIEFKKYSTRIRVVLPTEEQVEAVRRYQRVLQEQQQQNQLRNAGVNEAAEEEKSTEDEQQQQQMNAATQTQASPPPQLPQRPVAIVPPTVVQRKTNPAASFSVMDTADGIADGVPVPSSPIVHEPMPTDASGQPSNRAIAADDSDCNSGYSLNDPSQPPPYSMSMSISFRHSLILPPTERERLVAVLTEFNKQLEPDTLRNITEEEEEKPGDENGRDQQYFGGGGGSRPKSARSLIPADMADGKLNSASSSAGVTVMDFAVPPTPSESTESFGLGPVDPSQPSRLASSTSMVCHSGEDVVMGGEQEEEEDLQSGDEGEQQLLLGTDDIDDPMIGSCPSTPKISPVVSDASGDESYGMERECIAPGGGGGCGDLMQQFQEEGARRFRGDMAMARRQLRAEKQMRMDEKMMLFSRDNFDASTAATVGTLTTEMATTTTESRGEPDDTQMSAGGGGPGSGGAGDRLEDLDCAAASDTLVGGTESTSDTATASSTGGGAGVAANLAGETQTTNAAALFSDKEEAENARRAKWLRDVHEQGTIRLLGVQQDEGRKDEGPNLLLNVDKRMRVSMLKEWLAYYIRLDMDKFKLHKHYNDNDTGYMFDSSGCERVGEAIHANNHISVHIPASMLPPVLSKEDGESDNLVEGPNNTSNGCDSQRWKRRERPLRIKIMSVSESEDQQQN